MSHFPEANSASNAAAVQSLTVALGSNSYPIHIGAGASEALFAELAALQQAKRPLFAVTSPAVATAQANFFETLKNFGVAIHVLPRDGEPAKSIATYARLLEALAQADIDRSGVLIAVGGGVVGDLAGFAAATYLRGITCLQVPTTLLAMVDSSVGGKTGVNLAAGKNLVGAFHQPRAVYADTRFLATLPKREFAAGVGEIIKYGLLGDRTLYAQLQAVGALSWEHPALAEIIRRCCEIKAAVVAQDEHETSPENGRALLNLGHTFGHAIEKTAGYGEYLHGEAVAIGLMLAAHLSHRLGYFAETHLQPLETLITQNDLPAELRSPLLLDALLDAMKHDKKVRSGVLRFVLLREIGTSFTRSLDDLPLLRELWLNAGAGTIPA